MKDRKTKKPLQILNSIHGSVEPDHVLDMMGPSRSGKTTFPNVLAHRTSLVKDDIRGRIMLNGQITRKTAIRQVSTYVEQEDAMIGI